MENQIRPRSSSISFDPITTGPFGHFEFVDFIIGGLVRPDKYLLSTLW